MRKVETHRKIDQRVRSLRVGPPSPLARLGDWWRGRQIERLEKQLQRTSEQLLRELKSDNAKRVASAIVTSDALRLAPETRRD